MKTTRKHLLNETGTNLVSEPISLKSAMVYSISIYLDSGAVSVGSFVLKAANGMVTDGNGNPTDWETVESVDLSDPANANTQTWIFNYANAGYLFARVEINQPGPVTARVDGVIKE